MFKTTLLAFMVMFVLTPYATMADFYKYVDKNGKTVFTDDISTIPKKQRQKAEKYHEPPPSIKAQESTKTSDDQQNSGKSKNSSATKEEMLLKKETLEKKQAELKQEYEALMKEKANLERLKAEAKGREKIKAYNEQVLQFSEKLNNYNKKRTALEGEVAEYNSAIEIVNKKAEKK